MEEPYTKRIAVTEADYGIIQNYASTCRAVSRDAQKKSRAAPPPLAPALEELLEIAYRCIADHGADFAKPARHHQALEIRRKVNAIPKARPKKRGQRGKDLKPRRPRTQ